MNRSNDRRMAELADPLSSVNQSRAEPDPNAGMNSAMLAELTRLRQLEEKRQKNESFSVTRVIALFIVVSIILLFFLL